MNWSFKIARLWGINVYMHWTFLILLGWILISNLNQGQTFAQSLMGVAFILVLFGCVVLHEYGHALTARRFGIVTKNITLLPIGGVANMEKMPEKPIQELWVALAGPAVNVVIAIGLFVYFQIIGGFPKVEEFTGEITTRNFLFNVFVVNIVLALFNMIPAFPMDGGRVLRALLAMRYDRGQATNIAAKIGQLLAIAFVFLGFFYNFWWIFIGLFIFLGAGAEANFETTRSALSKYKVHDVLMRQFTIFHTFETIEKAVSTLLDGQEKEFLVEQDNEIIGIITRDEIIQGLRELGQAAAIGRIANKQFYTLSPNMPLQEAYEKMIQAGASICPVIENGALVGVLNMENITEVVMLANAGLDQKSLLEKGIKV
ncbi:MAG: site-2 protease family protein [Saprospiraceae bacterium]|nr:site-2 protease family protein [Saprospiraceae bacterium]